jgi:GNAT superfamily N-acetyltransferase
VNDRGSIDSYTLRRAHPDDDRAIELLRIASWEVAYRHLIPARYFDDWDVDGVIERRRANALPGVGRLVACRADGSIAAFILYGPNRDGDVDNAGEIYALYAAESAWGTGAGPALMNVALDELRACPIVTLWVLRDNPRARAFYTKAGFAPDGAEKLAELPNGLRLPEIRYRRWRPAADEP